MNEKLGGKIVRRLSKLLLSSSVDRFVQVDLKFEMDFHNKTPNMSFRMLFLRTTTLQPMALNSLLWNENRNPSNTNPNIEFSNAKIDGCNPGQSPKNKHQNHTKRIMEFQLKLTKNEDQTNDRESPSSSPTSPLNKPYEQTSSFLGKGSYAKVYLGYWKSTNERVAVKVVDLSALKSHASSAKLLKLQLYEIEALTQVDHKNVIQLLYHQNIESRLELILEFCDFEFSSYLFERERVAISSKNHTSQNNCYADGKEMMKKKKKPCLSEPEIQYWARQLCDGLKALRQHNIVHRDLKPKNLMLKVETHPGEKPLIAPNINSLHYSKLSLKIADMGFSKELSDNDVTSTYCGTKYYMAPEIRAKGRSKYGYKVDLWSTGVIISRMITGVTNKNFTDMSHQRALKNLQNEYQLSNICIDLVARLLENDPEKRIGIDDFYNHPFLNYQEKIGKSIQTSDLLTSCHKSDGANLPKLIGIPTEKSKQQEILEQSQKLPEHESLDSDVSIGSPLSPIEDVSYSLSYNTKKNDDQCDPCINGSTTTTIGIKSSGNNIQSNTVNSLGKREKNKDSYFLVKSFKRLFDPISGFLNRYNDKKTFRFTIKEAQPLLITIYNNDQSRPYLDPQPVGVTIRKIITKNDFENTQSHSVLTSYEMEMMFTEQDVANQSTLEITLEPQTNVLNSLCSITSELPFRIDILVQEIGQNVGYSTLQ